MEHSPGRTMLTQALGSKEDRAGMGIAQIPDVRCHAWDVKLGSSIKMGFIPSNWWADPLILGSGRGCLNPKALGCTGCLRFAEKITASTPAHPFLPQHPSHMENGGGHFLKSRFQPEGRRADVVRKEGTRLIEAGGPLGETFPNPLLTEDTTSRSCSERVGYVH